MLKSEDEDDYLDMEYDPDYDQEDDIGSDIKGVVTPTKTRVQDLTTIGVGTFSDVTLMRLKRMLKPKFTDKSRFFLVFGFIKFSEFFNAFFSKLYSFPALNPSGSLSDIRFKTYKRVKSCKQCENCLRPDCRTCQYCKDSKKYGGPGNLKKACK